MIHPNFPYQLYLVISESDCKNNNMLTVAEAAIKGGVDIIQLREKNASSSEFYEKAIRLKEITDRYQIPLIINDHLETAINTNAHGIHVGNHDIPPNEIQKLWKTKEHKKMIGYSVEYLEQLNNEQTKVSDYLGISPVFQTNTKMDTVTEWGISGIETIRSLTDKPLVAIGNIKQENIKPIIQAGANCVAVVSAICSSSNPEKTAFQLKNELLK